MLRIAVAGGGGLGSLLATGLAQADSAYAVVVLSRTTRPELAARDVQVQPVNYYDHQSLTYALRGIDLVISTITGPEQLNLILAAGESRVQRFVPAEFEGSLGCRPRDNPMDRGSSQALELLAQMDQMDRLKYTVFSCGIFMEAFLPYGLGSLGIGYGAGVAGPGYNFLDTAKATAEYAEFGSEGRPACVCLTSVHDLVRFVVAAVDLDPTTWPIEFTMRGDRLTLRDLVDSFSLAQNILVGHHVLLYPDLVNCYTYYTRSGNFACAMHCQRLIFMADGRYDFSDASLNDAVARSSVADVQPLTFDMWLATIWVPSS